MISLAGRSVSRVNVDVKHVLHLLQQKRERGSYRAAREFTESTTREFLASLAMTFQRAQLPDQGQSGRFDVKASARVPPISGRRSGRRTKSNGRIFGIFGSPHGGIFAATCRFAFRIIRHPPVSRMVGAITLRQRNNTPAARRCPRAPALIDCARPVLDESIRAIKCATVG